MPRKRRAEPPKPRQSMQERDRQIGAVLQAIREAEELPVSACAAYIGVSRDRYKDMEKGRSAITITQVEWLAWMFDIPLHELWLRVLEGSEPTPSTRGLDGTLLVYLQPGQRLEVQSTGQGISAPEVP